MKSNNQAIFHIIVTQLGWGLFLALNARRPFTEEMFRLSNRISSPAWRWPSKSISSQFCHGILNPTPWWITPAVLRIFAESYALVPGPGNSGDLDVWSSKSPLKLPPHGDSRLVKSQLISSAVFTALFAYMIVAPHCRGKALVQNPLISTTYLRPFKCLRPLSIL